MGGRYDAGVGQVFEFLLNVSQFSIWGLEEGGFSWQGCANLLVGGTYCSDGSERPVGHGRRLFFHVGHLDGQFGCEDGFREGRTRRREM